MRTGRPPQDIHQRFASKLEREDHIRPGQTTECWIWKGGMSKAGYGIFSMASAKAMLAHRAAYWLFVGDIPERHDVHHKCENSACCNTGHVEPKTRKAHVLAHNRKWDVCRKGHPLVDGNIYTNNLGHRRCAACTREREYAARREFRKLNPVKPHANAIKTECKRGHPFDAENTHITKTGGRICKKCWQMKKDEWNAKQSKRPARGTPKVKCKHGHDMTPENTYTYRGRRSCRKCILDRIHKSRKKRTLLGTPEPVGSKLKPEQAQAVNHNS